jgi:hypothetical protein
MDSVAVAGAEFPIRLGASFFNILNQMVKLLQCCFACQFVLNHAVYRLSSLYSVNAAGENDGLVGCRPFFFYLHELSKVLKFVRFKILSVKDDVLELLKTRWALTKQCVHNMVIKHF